jgi:hypothetical protein
MRLAKEVGAADLGKAQGQQAPAALVDRRYNAAGVEIEDGADKPC